MRIDVLTIFPEYLAPLGLSLIGKACVEGLLTVHVHDLRDFTLDRHRTVDDTPYGGGAGMVMRPEPWGAALDHVVASGPGVPHLLVPDPVGYAVQPGAWLGRCPRSRGWPSRAGATRASTSASLSMPRPGMPVTPVSLGDYVVGGGEVAALVIVEAVARLLPGVVGNAESPRGGVA